MILTGRWEVHRAPSLPCSPSTASHAEMAAWEGTLIPASLSLLTLSRHAMMATIWGGLDTLKAKDRTDRSWQGWSSQRPTWSIWPTNNQEEGNNQTTGSCAGKHHLWPWAEHLLPTRGGQNKDCWPAENIEKIVVKHYLSPKKKGGWGGNEDTTKPPLFTDFFAQII